MVALAIVVAVLLLGAVVIGTAAQSHARVQAQHAADGAALAGAFAAREAVAAGSDAQAEGCGQARSTAVLMGARVSRCEARGAVVTVKVEGARGVTAVAVAGPRFADV